MRKKTRWCQLFFSGMFLAIWPSLILPSMSIPPIHGSPGSKCYAEKQKKEEHGMGFKSSGRLLLLVPWPTPGCFKNESTLWGFVSYHKWASFCKQTANKNPSFGCKWWISGKPRKVSSIMGVIQQLPRFTRIRVIATIEGIICWCYADETWFSRLLGHLKRYGSSLCSRLCMVNFRDDLSVISS